MKRSNLSTWVYLFLVLASGAALGVFGDHLYTTKTVLAKSVAAKTDPNEFRRKYVEEMRASLKLNPNQVASLTQILDETRSKMHDLHEKYKPEMVSIHNNQVDRVKGILSETQRAQYEKLLQDRQNKRNEAK